MRITGESWVAVRRRGGVRYCIAGRRCPCCIAVFTGTYIGVVWSSSAVIWSVGPMVVGAGASSSMMSVRKQSSVVLEDGSFECVSVQRHRR